MVSIMMVNGKIIRKMDKEKKCIVMVKDFRVCLKMILKKVVGFCIIKVIISFRGLGKIIRKKGLVNFISLIIHLRKENMPIIRKSI